MTETPRRFQVHHGGLIAGEKGYVVTDTTGTSTWRGDTVFTTDSRSDADEHAAKLNEAEPAVTTRHIAVVTLTHGEFVSRKDAVVYLHDEDGDEVLVARVAPGCYIKAAQTLHDDLYLVVYLMTVEALAARMLNDYPGWYVGTWDLDDRFNDGDTLPERNDEDGD